MSKLLRMIRKSKSTTEARRHGEERQLPQIYADERGSGRAMELSKWEQESPKSTMEARRHGEEQQSPRIGDVRAFADEYGRAHAPPEWVRAA
jgi:hypothetical protein